MGLEVGLLLVEPSDETAAPGRGLTAARTDVELEARAMLTPDPELPCDKCLPRKSPAGRGLLHTDKQLLKTGCCVELEWGHLMGPRAMKDMDRKPLLKWKKTHTR